MERAPDGGIKCARENTTVTEGVVVEGEDVDGSERAGMACAITWVGAEAEGERVRIRGRPGLMKEY